MKQSFVRLDIFRKLPKDLTEPTFCGAFGKVSLDNATSEFRMHYSLDHALYDRGWQIPQRLD